MASNLKQTPRKDLSKINSCLKNTYEQQTIDTCSFGQSSGKSALEKQIIQKIPMKCSLKQVKKNLFIDQKTIGQTILLQKEQQHDLQEKSSQQQSERQQNQQITLLTEKQYQLILSQDLINLKQLQWLIKTFNKSINPLSKYTSKIMKKLEGYLRKSTFFSPTNTKSKKTIEYEQFLIDQNYSQKDNVQENLQKIKQTSQFTLICNEYILFTKQAIKKSLQPQFAPYKQQYLQSIILVIEDLSTFKKLQNDDLRNQMCQIVQEIEKNMIGKDQKKYVRNVHREFVNYLFKKMMQEEMLAHQLK